MPNKTLYLVDGSGYIFRAYYGVGQLSTRAGFPTNALLGFTRMMLKLVRDVSAEYIVLTFDTGEPTFRHQMYDQYKANRDECPDDLAVQMPYFRKIGRALNLIVYEQPGVEADDIIATLTRRFASPEQPIVIVSGDKDLCQLVDGNVTVWDAMRDIRYDSTGVKEKFGVLPEQMVDYLTLVGDTSDNVPGVKGVGPKTAVQLLERFKSLEDLLSQTAEIENIKGLRGAAGIRERIESNRELVRLSHELVTLKQDVKPFSELPNVEAFFYQGPSASGPNREELLSLFRELEFDALVDQFGGGAEKKKEQQPKNYAIVTRDSLADFAEQLSKQTAFAFDTETTSLDTLSCSLVGISISWQAGSAFYLPVCGAAEPERQLDLTEVRRLLNPIFSNPEVKKYGLNLKYDLSVLRTHGFTVRGLAFDSMLASYVLSPDRREHGLSALTNKHLGEEMQPYAELTKGLDNIGEVQIDAVARYACHDAEASFRLQEPLAAELSAASAGRDGVSALRAFETIEMPLIPVLEQMERAGIKIDITLISQLNEEFSAILVELEKRIQELAGEPFNLNSPKQLSVILFEKMAIPTQGLKRTQSGISTDASVLEKLAPEYEIVGKILEYRELYKLKSTYLEALTSLRDEVTGRVHTSFNQAIAATGRLSSTEPNLQNIPIRNPRGRRIREAFIAESGSTLISADYSQIELRVLAHMAGDKALQQAFHRGEDIHLTTAREIFGAVSESELKDLRRVAKTINFGIVYGMSAFRLARDLQISRTAAQQYIDSYFARYPGVRRYFDALEEQIEREGYTETLFGRRRFLRDIDTSGRDKGYAIRSLLNAPIQGSAAEIMKLAMIKLHEKVSARDDAKMVLQVHDELVFEVRESSAEEMRQIIVEGMEGAVELSVPLKVDVRLAIRWG